jgi:hypothetical protein
VPKINSTQSRDYAVERLTDGATTMVILDELTKQKKVAQGAALKAIDAAKELLSRNLDEDDYQMIRACAFGGDSYRQQFYRERIDALGETQEALKTDPELDTETRTRLILSCDRTIQAYCTLSLRGRRDLPVAFAPKAVLQNQNPPTDEEIEDEINGAL